MPDVSYRFYHHFEKACPDLNGLCPRPSILKKSEITLEVGGWVQVSLGKTKYVVPAHHTSDMSRSTISPESRSKLEMVILSSLRFRTI